MLPAYYRFRVLNSTDQTLTYNNGARVEVRITPWKMTSGAMAQGAEISDTTSILNAGESIAAAAEAEGDIHDNTSNLYIGFTGTFKVVADQNSTDGTVYLFMEGSTDNSVWPSDAADFDVIKDCTLICAMELSTDAEDEDRVKDIVY